MTFVPPTEPFPEAVDKDEESQKGSISDFRITPCVVRYGPNRTIHTADSHLQVVWWRRLLRRLAGLW